MFGVPSDWISWKNVSNDCVRSHCKKERSGV